jgi:hypothetical protein
VIVVSLLLNIAVLVAVAGSLIAKAAWTSAAYGDRTPARDILLAIYLAILIGSVGLLVIQIVAPTPWATGGIVALLGLQIVYKLLTAVTVQRALLNPVVLSNLGIAAVHAVTLAIVATGS